MKYIVHISVTGRIDLEVEAENSYAAYGKALTAFESADLSSMEVIYCQPIHCKDETGKIVKTY